MVDKLDKKEEESLLDQLSKVEVKETGDEVIIVEGIEQNDTSNSNTNSVNKQTTNEFLSNDSWEDLKIKEPIIKALHEMGFNKPSKIQTMSLSLINKYPLKHLAGQSQNGSGKTGAFSIPLVNSIDESKDEIQGVILAHNREMITQIVGIIAKMTKYTKITCQAILRDKDASKAHIIVTTAAQFGKYFIDTRQFPYEQLKMFIVDEADFQFTNNGSRQVLESYFKSKSRGKTQIIMFSATFTEDNYKFIKSFFDKKIICLKLEKNQLTLEKVKQMYIVCSETDKEKHKDKMVEEIIKSSMDNDRIIIFVNKRDNCDSLTTRLRNKGYTVYLLMGGDMSLENRDETIKKFNEGKIKILITTDLLSRGFDERLVKLVINYDIPVRIDLNTKKWYVDKETYLHRIGRTGRFNTNGLALNLVLDRYKSNIKEIEEFYETKITEIKSMDELINDYKKLLAEY